MASAVDRHRGSAFAGQEAGLDALGIPAAAAPRSTPPAIIETCSDLDSSDDDDNAPDSPSAAAVMSPPYWVVSSAAPRRNASSLSVDSGPPAGAITLRDNDTSEHSDRNDACWAKSVEVVDYTVVNGSATNIGAFVVWNVRVETLRGSYMTVRKRYSEFDELRAQLMLSFPSFEAAMPVLPPKSIISRFRPKFLEKRRAGLQYFLNCIMLNPEFSGSPVLRAFLFP
ncbi:PX domain-containing protein [Hirsutella rhossiliensis]|uniref:Endosomal/vacuolar adapter protein YPT35 n=1 Tax=Hirsutella rhossiliensis TaxID=111463 RepID=A0A9P8SNN8_9HYPO|nr:PX domain-containing protein [Hirsutella rhossiliensis]KAH0968599.1 PX domain-containing protein [Hirsutella rhossiliensis]